MANKQLKVFLESLIIAEEITNGFNNGMGNRSCVYKFEDKYLITNWHTFEYLDVEIIFSFIYDDTIGKLTFHITSKSLEQSQKSMSDFKKFLSRKSQGKITIDLLAGEGVGYKLLLKGNVDFLKEFIASRIEYVDEFYLAGVNKR